MLGLSRQSQGAGLQALDSRLRGNDKGGFCSHRSQGQRCNGAAIPSPIADRTFHSHRSQGQRCNGGGSTVVLCLYKFHSHRSQGQRCNFAIHEWTEGAKYVSLPPEPGAALQLLLMLASASSIAVSLPPEPGAALQPYRAPLGLQGPSRFPPSGSWGSVAPATPPVPAVQLGGFTPTGARGSVATKDAIKKYAHLLEFHSHRSQGQRCNFYDLPWRGQRRIVSLPPEPGAALQLLLMLASASSIAVSLPPEPGAALQPYRAPLGLLGPYRFTPTGARGSVATATPPVPAVQLGGFTPTGARGSVATKDAIKKYAHLLEFHSHRSQGQRCNFYDLPWRGQRRIVSLPPEPGAALQLLLMLASASSIAVSLPPEPGAALQPYRAPLGLLGPYRYTPTGARGSVATLPRASWAARAIPFHSHRSQGQRCNRNASRASRAAWRFHSHRSQGQRCNQGRH